MTLSLRYRLILISSCLLNGSLCTPIFGEDAPPSAVDSHKEITPNPSEDSEVANFHSLGEIAGHSNIYRSANPVGAIAEKLKGQEPSELDRTEAKARMQHLYDRGIRTVVSLQKQEPPTETSKNPEYSEVVLEKSAAEEAGITYVAYSMSNKGQNSLQYMPSADVSKLVEIIGNDIVDRSKEGGVVFHCKSGKDRTGLVAGYLRIKYQNWTLADALDEMRQNGHVWKKFLKPGQSLSWHEQHLQAISCTLTAAK